METASEIDRHLKKEIYKTEPDEVLIRELVAKGGNLNSIIDEEGISALMDCVEDVQYNGHDIRLVRLLVELGADVNHQSSDGETALYVACHAGSTELFEYLLAHGADPNLILDHDPDETVLDHLLGDAGMYSSLALSGRIMAEAGLMEENPEETSMNDWCLQMAELIRSHGGNSIADLRPERPEESKPGTSA